MTATNPPLDSLFNGGPPLKIEQRLRLVRPGDRRIAPRAAWIALIAWFPLLLLTTGQEILFHNGSWRTFMLDFGAHARFLFAAPLLIVAESWCIPLLGNRTRHFLDSGIVRERDSERFAEAVFSTRWLLNSTFAEILTVIFAYGAAVALRASSHTPSLAHWSMQQESRGLVLSAAGVWQAWVSLPLLFMLFWGWIWRQFLWCRLMWRIAGFDLRLVASHPDRAGGLKFLGTVVRGYQLFGFAMGTIVAGNLANQVRGGAGLYDFRFFVAGVLLFVVVFVVAPFAVYVPVLRRVKGRGTLEYGALSCAVGHELEAKWVKNGPRNVTPEVLDAPDFSATTDLYQIASNVYQIRYLPLDSRAVGELIVFTLIPFVPVVLLSVPLEVLLNGLKQILL